MLKIVFTVIVALVIKVAFGVAAYTLVKTVIQGLILEGKERYYSSSIKERRSITVKMTICLFVLVICTSFLLSVK